ncbi:hypothetical protein ACVWXU_004003 [Streptomyces sp. TE33382]
MIGGITTLTMVKSTTTSDTPREMATKPSHASRLVGEGRVGVSDTAFRHSVRCNAPGSVAEGEVVGLTGTHLAPP